MFDQELMILAEDEEEDEDELPDMENEILIS
jgi:hypothetical protein